MFVTESSLGHAIETIELIQSVYYGDEFRFRNKSDQLLYDELVEYREACTLQDRLDNIKEHTISFQVSIHLADDNDETPLILVVDIMIWLTEPQRCDMKISTTQQSPWLHRSLHEQLSALFDAHWKKHYKEHIDKDDRASLIMMVLDELSTIAAPILEAYTQQQRQQQQQQQQQESAGPVKCIREWLWLPMIYTKEKRGHIVSWAPNYDITGILMSGKPGMLCLEGTEKSVASFINDIKTISWADIPAGHKKISTKYQERFECDNMDTFNQTIRKFKNMQELKFDTSGKFRNHSDLVMLKKWMTEHNVDYAFGHLFDYN
ncbi:uncharacterized protein BX664DRAFT_382090 [Halteromyces radiatus]|uniref:uncharacterized protein n=1 Tax=Halteromyces radiatus TaxID=101107 RepID=UPI0022200D37|nr:uncharacterized protein BX664DRAFT_382090 [Halteromyces radiatus]KAI8099566.1 hypothetical protein BX664DRAFT_382090 [Halteromyces radiatus]